MEIDMSPPGGLQCNIPQYTRDLLLKLNIQVKHLTNDYSSAIDTATFSLGMLQQKLYSALFENIRNQNLFL